MSQPISSCTIIKAALGDQKAFEWLVTAMEYNRLHGAFTIFPCKCDPPCPKPPDEKMLDLNTRIERALDERRRAYKHVQDKIRERFDPKGDKGEPGKLGSFDKWMFPAIKHWGLRQPWWKRIWNRLRGRPTSKDYDLREVLLAQPMKE